jgi:hypothetical protein
MSPGLGLVLRASIRTGWRGLLGLAVLVGVASGAVLTGVEAARRTDSAFDRMVVATEAWDVLVNPDNGTDSALRFEDLAALPMVAEAGRYDGVGSSPAHVESIADLTDSFIVLAATDGRGRSDLSRPAQLDGRMPDPDAAHEVFLSGPAAEFAGVEAGDRFEIRVLTFEDFGEIEQVRGEEAILEVANSDDWGQVVEVEVTGTGNLFDEIVVDEGFNTGSMLVTPAFWERYDQPSAGYWAALVRLRPGADLGEFRRAVEALVPDESIAFQTQSAVEEQADRAVGPQVAALWVFTAIAGLVGLVIVLQAVSRRIQLDATLHGPLRALGLTRAQRAGISLARVAMAVGIGVVLGLVIAVLASPVAPVGIARDAEPDPGIRAEWGILFAAGAVFAVIVMAGAIWPALRAARSRPRRPARSVAAAWAAGAGLRPPIVAGTRFALDPSPGNVPTRSTLVGAATSVVLVVATITFAASLDHFVTTPPLYGLAWDHIVFAENEVSPEQADDILRTIGEQDEILAYGLLLPGQVELDGQSVPAMALEPSSRPVRPTIIDGRAPAAVDEVALGTTTLDELDAEVGDRVPITRGEDRSGSVTVVGRAVLPAVASYSGSDKTTLGDGALLSPEGLDRWSPGFDPVGAVIEVAGDADADDVVHAVSEEHPDALIVAEPADAPSDVTSLERVRSTPLILTGLLAVLIALTVVHALGAAVRARRRDVAILRTFGFTRRQVLAAVSTQATLIGLIGLVVGVPVGIVLGRLSWTRIVEQLGAIVDLVTPVLAIALVAVAVLAIANLVGLVPALRAARAHPADTLRTE